MKSISKLATIAASLLILSNAPAAVVIDFNVDSVRTSAGALVPTSGLGLLLADTAGDGFGAINAGGISAGDMVGSFDYIIYRADFSAFGTDGVWSQSTGLLTLTGSWTAGDNLAFVWFPTLTIASTTVSGGVSYGLLSNSGIWTTPADGTSTTDPYQIISVTNNGFFSSNAATLSVTDNQSQASLTTVPEPATLALFAGGLTAFVIFRRRSMA